MTSLHKRFTSCKNVPPFIFFKTSSHNIYQDSKLLGPVVWFAKLVSTGLWAIKKCTVNSISAQTKGQLISKSPFGVFKSTKKTNEIFVRISALASKKRSNQNNKSLYITNCDDFILTLLHYFFDLTSLEARAEIQEKKSLFFRRFEDTKRTF